VVFVALAGGIIPARVVEFTPVVLVELLTTVPLLIIVVVVVFVVFVVGIPATLEAFTPTVLSGCSSLSPLEVPVTPAKLIGVFAGITGGTFGFAFVAFEKVLFIIVRLPNPVAFPVLLENGKVPFVINVLLMIVKFPLVALFADTVALNPAVAFAVLLRLLTVVVLVVIIVTFGEVLLEGKVTFCGVAVALTAV